MFIETPARSDAHRSFFIPQSVISFFYCIFAARFGAWGMVPLGEKGTGWESRTDGAAVCPLFNTPYLSTVARSRLLGHHGKDRAQDRVGASQKTCQIANIETRN